MPYKKLGISANFCSHTWAIGARCSLFASDNPFPIWRRWKNIINFLLGNGKWLCDAPLQRLNVSQQPSPAVSKHLPDLLYVFLPIINFSLPSVRAATTASIAFVSKNGHGCRCGQYTTLGEKVSLDRRTFKFLRNPKHALSFCFVGKAGIPQFCCFLTYVLVDSYFENKTRRIRLTKTFHEFSKVVLEYKDIYRLLSTRLSNLNGAKRLPVTSWVHVSTSYSTKYW